MLLILSLSFICHEISAVGPEGHCTSHFKRAMCRFHVDRMSMFTRGRGQAHVDAS